jgi:hypothetical protein
MSTTWQHFAFYRGTSNWIMVAAPSERYRPSAPECREWAQRCSDARTRMGWGIRCMSRPSVSFPISLLPEAAEHNTV